MGCGRGLLRASEVVTRKREIGGVHILRVFPQSNLFPTRGELA